MSGRREVGVARWQQGSAAATPSAQLGCWGAQQRARCAYPRPRGGSSHQYHPALINPRLFLIPSVVWLLCWNSLPKEGFLGGVKASFGRLGSGGGVWGKHRPPVPPPQNPPPHTPLLVFHYNVSTPP